LRKHITALMMLLLGGTGIAHAQCITYSLGYDVYSSESFDNIQVGAGGPVPGYGSVAISGNEQSAQICTHHLAGGDCETYRTAYDSGTVSITVNGVYVSTSYGEGSTASTIASALVTAINSTPGTLVVASANGSAVLLTAKATGVGTNYTLSSTSSTSQPATFGGPSFSSSPSGSVLVGGSATSDLVHTITSVLVDGSASMTLDQSAPGCTEPEYGNLVAELPYATHTPLAYNVVNGVGGWGSGSSECVTCYLSVQTTEDSGPVNYGVSIPFTSGGEVDCSVGGIIWDPIVIGNIPVCVIPTTEYTAVQGTEATTETQFVQTIFDTAGDNFNGRTVTESDAAPGQDTCWFQGSTVDKYTGMTGGSWIVDSGQTAGQPNAWGYDVVGWSTAAITYYRQQAAAHNTTIPCSLTGYQALTISCPAGNAAIYTSATGNTLMATINQTSVVNRRNDITSTASQTITY